MSDRFRQTAEALGSGTSSETTLWRAPCPQPRDGSRVRLWFRGVAHAEESFAVRVFVDQREATAATELAGNDHYAGSFWMYGHGRAVGEAVQARPGTSRDRVTVGSLEPFDTFLDITRALERLDGNRAGGERLFALVLVDPSGAPRPASRFRVEHLEVEHRTPGGRGSR